MLCTSIGNNYTDFTLRSHASWPVFYVTFIFIIRNSKPHRAYFFFVHVHERASTREPIGGSSIARHACFGDCHVLCTCVIHMKCARIYTKLSNVFDTNDFLRGFLCRARGLRFNVFECGPCDRPGSLPGFVLYEKLKTMHCRFTVCSFS